jgi:hypothetical protein
VASLRTIGVPLDHLLAELIAFPLSSEWSLRNPLSTIDPALQGRSRALWEATEQQLLSSIPGFSVDELVALRDAIWFRGSLARVTLHDYLHDLANDFLQVDGPLARPKLPRIQDGLGGLDCSPQVAARQALRWITFALPRDLLLAGHTKVTAGLDLISPALARTLGDEGYVEAHLHLGAGLDFETIWPGTLLLLGNRALHERFFESPGAAFDGGRQLASWLLHAGVTRYLLGTFLARPPSDRHGCFARYFQSLMKPLVRAFGAGAFALLRQTLLGLRSGRLRDISFVELRELYAQLTSVRTLGTPRTLEDWGRLDPLWRQNRLAGTTPEIAFMRRGLAYLADNPADADVFGGLFWQVVRTRCALYRHIVQRPLTPGLEWFVRFYNRMARSRHKMPDTIKTLAAARICGVSQGLRALEVRTAPEAEPGKFLAQVREIRDAASTLQRGNPAFPEVGLVYHFTKERGASAAHWSGSHADPTQVRTDSARRRGKNLSGVRYGTFFASRRRQAQALVWVLHHYPDTIRLIRGIDVCTDELGVPNWVLAPLVRHVRKAAANAGRSARVASRFGTTIHAGEDFVHLLTGLRNLDEAIDSYRLEDGDRIGHGLALGVEPREWARRAGRLAVLVEDRLFDLVWVWRWMAGVSGHDGGGAHLEREIRDRTRDMFGSPVAPYDVLELMRQLGREDALKAAGFPGEHRACARTPNMLRRYLSDPALFRAGRKTVWVDPIRDCDILQEVQGALRKKVAARGISIEVNPTSNLLIGDFGNLASHPLWRLRPPKSDPTLPELSLSIGSDDPVVFASNIREEYQWLQDAMSIAGISDEEARRWIDRTRQCGLETRFTLRERIGSIAELPNPHGESPPFPL